MGRDKKGRYRKGHSVEAIRSAYSGRFVSREEAEFGEIYDFVSKAVDRFLDRSAG